MKMTQEYQNRELYESTVSKLNTTGFIINLVVPAIMLFLGFYLRTQVFNPPDLGASTISVLLYTLIAVSLIEVVVAFFLKRRLFSNLDKYFTGSYDLEEQVGLVAKMMIIIHVLSATPVLYGLLYYFLGGSLEGFLMMVILNLLGFQACRIRKSDAEKLEEYFTGAVQ